MLNREIERYKELFSNPINKVYFVGSEEHSDWYVDVTTNSSLVAFERPDLILYGVDKVLAIEHFEFDCYKRTKKGSKHRREIDRIDRKMDSIKPMQNVQYLEDVIEGETSFEYYLSNAIGITKAHYGNISEYMSNIKDRRILNDSQNLKIMFWIDDVSPLGTNVIGDTGNLQQVEILRCKEFLDIVSYMDGVDYIMSTSGCNDQKSIVVLAREDIELLYNEPVDYRKYQFVDFDANVIGFAFSLK